MIRFLWGVLFILSSLIHTNSDPVIWSGVGYFVDSGLLLSGLNYLNIIMNTFFIKIIIHI